MAQTEEGSRHSITENRGIKVIERVTINCPAEQLFRHWRNVENLPRFITHLASVKAIDEKVSHWVTNAPGGRQLEWDAEIINEHPFEMIAWRSREGADVPNAGSIRFDPGPVGRGTVVTVTMEYVPPGGVVGQWLAKLFGEDPAQQIHGDLRRFKSLMETGEIPTIEGQPAGPKS